MEDLRQQLPAESHIYMTPDGKGDYPSIQAAVDAIPDHYKGTTIIHLAPGVYRETVEISGSKRNVKLLGREDGRTEIVYDLHAGGTMDNGEPRTTFRTATVAVYCDHFQAENIVFNNDYDNSRGGGRQALALLASGEHQKYYHCEFHGGQDTLYVRDGSQYFEDCTISGDVDFIFGGARAVFYKCHIYCSNPTPEETTRRGYIAAPSTPCSQRFGMLFDQCEVDGNFGEGTMFLGRPWHPGSDPYAVGQCTFMHCHLSSIIIEAGWKQMGGFLPKNNRLYEFENEGPGAVEHEERRQLTPEEAADYTIERVLGWTDLGWL